MSDTSKERLQQAISPETLSENSRLANCPSSGFISPDSE
ncbi:hypothetical protein F385_161 [Pantoea agglomerans 299R]|nr:hypothetical protein F385_161 [Pantoea agglomerans 299R]